MYLASSRKIILGGDFNFVESLSLDKEGGDSSSGNVGVNCIRDYKRDFNLVDPFREIYPNKRCFSYSQGGIHTRLDRFYICNDLTHFVDDVYISPCTVSDHSYVEIYFKDFDPSTFKYGPGFWKLNVSVLEDQELVDRITRLWEDKLKGGVNKDGVRWEYCKREFRKTVIDYCKNISDKVRQKIQDLEREIAFMKLINENALGGNSFDREIDGLKSQLHDVVRKRLEGSKIRARISHIESTEKPTRFFLRKETQNRKRKTLVK